jgi:predicted AlkP superfamily pyrophosphatase or phosphodiesterase
MKKYTLILFISIFLTNYIGCKTDGAIKDLPNNGSNVLEPKTNYSTKNVIIIIMDGARYSECWGDTSHQHIPNITNTIVANGITCTNFFNNGSTLTNPGHSAITTGVYQNINNGGAETPQNPSIFNYYLQSSKKKQDACWVITSKDKLQVLNNCTNTSWKDTFQPMTDCGNNGLASGYRHDTITLQHALNILKNYHPNISIINFREPDYTAHGADSLGYIKGIEDVDGYIKKIWDLIQSDTAFKDKTTLIVTNDHGRHLDGTANGYISHGDDCYGCRHINFFAYGPDFKKNTIVNTTYEQIDIPATIAELMGFKIPTSEGKVMWDFFIKK